MQTRRTHIVIPESIAKEIDQLVGKRGRSLFLTQAAEKEIRRLHQVRALEQAAGAWKDSDHPELKSGASNWVRQLRDQSEKRKGRVAKR